VRPARGPETNPEAAIALDSIVAALEQSRYAPPTDLPAQLEALRAATDTCVDALRAGVAPAARYRAEWWPASVISRRKTRALRQPLERTQATEGMVDNLR
jgi:hypothetical protein